VISNPRTESSIPELDMDALCGFDDEPDVSITQHDESRPATIQDEERGQFNHTLQTKP
jgi:hypothetical protein